MNDHTLVPEAIVEQATLKALVAQLEGCEPNGETYDSKVKVLCEYVKYDVKEEQEEMFLKARALSLDLNLLGERIAARKAQLLAARTKASWNELGLGRGAPRFQRTNATTSSISRSLWLANKPCAAPSYSMSRHLAISRAALRPVASIGTVLSAVP